MLVFALKLSSHAWSKAKMSPSNLLDKEICQKSSCLLTLLEPDAFLFPLSPLSLLLPVLQPNRALFQLLECVILTFSGLGALVHELPRPGTHHADLD